jgi:hypothetical protein
MDRGLVERELVRGQGGLAVVLGVTLHVFGVGVAAAAGIGEVERVDLGERA